jgi:hypothetical protein
LRLNICMNNSLFIMILSETILFLGLLQQKLINLKEEILVLLT